MGATVIKHTGIFVLGAVALFAFFIVCAGLGTFAQHLGVPGRTGGLDRAMLGFMILASGFIVYGFGVVVLMSSEEI